MRIRRPSTAVVIGTVIAGISVTGFALGAGASSANHGTPPPLPDLSHAQSMPLAGADGKTIVVAGKPVMVCVSLPSSPGGPPPASKPLTAAQIAAAQKAGPVVWTIPAQTDAQKAALLGEKPGSKC